MWLLRLIQNDFTPVEFLFCEQNFSEKFCLKCVIQSLQNSVFFIQAWFICSCQFKNSQSYLKHIYLETSLHLPGE